MSYDFLKIDFNAVIKNNKYKSYFKTLRSFCRYKATVGIHVNDGKKPMPRYYSQDFSIFKAGRTKMNLIKVAYQNEFGALIPIKPIYKVATMKDGYGKKIQTKYKTYTKQRYVKKYVLDSAKVQGFLLLSKTGKFCMYKKPGSFIKIPERSFIRKTANNPGTSTVFRITNALRRTFNTTRGLTARQSFKEITRAVYEDIRNNVRNTGKPNHSRTVKAKGFDYPLKDEQDRIYNAIRYKIYKDADILATKSAADYLTQTTSTMVDKKLKSIEKYLDKGIIESFTRRENVKTWGNKTNRNYNPYYKRRR